MREVDSSFLQTNEHLSYTHCGEYTNANVLWFTYSCADGMVQSICSKYFCPTTMKQRACKMFRCTKKALWANVTGKPIPPYQTIPRV